MVGAAVLTPVLAVGVCRAVLAEVVSSTAGAVSLVEFLQLLGQFIDLIPQACRLSLPAL